MARYTRFRYSPENAAEPVERWGRVEGDAVQLLTGNPVLGETESDISIPLAETEDLLAPVEPPNIIAIGANYSLVQ